MDLKDVDEEGSKGLGRRYFHPLPFLDELVP